MFQSQVRAGVAYLLVDSIHASAWLRLHGEEPASREHPNSGGPCYLFERTSHAAALLSLWYERIDLARQLSDFSLLVAEELMALRDRDRLLGVISGNSRSRTYGGIEPM